VRRLNEEDFIDTTFEDILKKYRRRYLIKYRRRC
jgi:hypothetical protein